MRSVLRVSEDSLCLSFDKDQRGTAPRPMPMETITPPRPYYALRVLRSLQRMAASPIVTALAVGHLIFQLSVIWPRCLGNFYSFVDADIYARAAQNVWRGEPLYPLTPHGDLLDPVYHLPLPFLYSPAFAAAIAPLGALPARTIVHFFHLLGFVSFWGYAAALAWIVNRCLTWRGVLGAGFVAMMTPGMSFNVLSGQIETFLQLCFVLATIGISPGVLLAASLLIKPFAIWPLALFALRQPRRIIPSALLTVLVGGLLGALVCGPAAYREWLHYAPAKMYSLVFGNKNTSFALLPLRWAGYTSLPSWGRVYLEAIFILVPGLVAWLMRQRPTHIQAAWTAAAAMLVAPFSHPYYVPLLLTPIAWEIRGLLEEANAEEQNKHLSSPSGGEFYAAGD